MNNTTSTVDVKFVLEKSTNSNNTFSVVYDGIISKSDQLNFTQELKMQDWVGWRWKIYSGNEWSEFNYSDYFEGCWDVTGIEYDNSLYKKDGLRESMITHTYVKSQVLVLNKAMIGEGV